jgi:hypothetical protein
MLKKFLSGPSTEKRLSFLSILYLMFGLFFAVIYAFYYKWPLVGYFSPGFFMVLFSWPYQAIGFIRDLLYYGLAGKPF